MLEIQHGDGQAVLLRGRLDAAQAERAQIFLDTVQPPCVLDLHALEYISSAGLGVLLRTHKRLLAGGGIRLINVNPHVVDIFRYSGMDKLFAIEAGPRD